MPGFPFLRNAGEKVATITCCPQGDAGLLLPMMWMVVFLTLLSPALLGQTLDAVVPTHANPQPTRLTIADLKEYESLPAARKHLLELALAVLNDFPWLPYLDGGAEPEVGGFDCSGAMYFVMRKAGLDPPRSSAAQCAWLKENGRLHEVAVDATDEKDPSLAGLKPGDLLFWSKPGSSADGPAITRIHHVAMFLGTEKKDGHPVIINATDGRSYRGRKANGYGIYDFRVPKADSPSRLTGYGTPPGIGVE